MTRQKEDHRQIPLLTSLLGPSGPNQNTGCGTPEKAPLLLAGSPLTTQGPTRGRSGVTLVYWLPGKEGKRRRVHRVYRVVRVCRVCPVPRGRTKGSGCIQGERALGWGNFRP